MNDYVAFRRKSIIVSDIIKESWQLVYGLKFPFFWRMLLIFLAKGIISFLAISLLFSTILLPHSSIYLLITMGVFICILSYFVWWLCISGIILGLRQSIGLVIKEKIVLANLKKTKRNIFYLFLLVAIIYSLFLFCTHFMPVGRIGMLFKIALYLATLYCTLPLFLFALPLIVTKQSSLCFAIKSSFITMEQHWLKIFTCFAFMIVILAISILPLGVGLIWSIPMSFAMIGILFRNIYGLKNNHHSKMLMLEHFLQAPDQMHALIQLRRDFLLPYTG